MMFLNRRHKILLVAVLAASITSCSKKTAGEKDTELPVIILTTPVSNQTFTPGQTINISGSITDNTSIAEVHIHVTNVATGTKYLDVHIYPGSSMTSFSNQDLVAVAGISYKVQIIAIDRSVNEAISTIEVSCN